MEENKSVTPTAWGAAEYHREIVDIVDKIEDVEVLKKIYTVAKTHLYILSKKEGN